MSLIDTLLRLLPTSTTPTERASELRKKRDELGGRLRDVELESAADVTQAGVLSAEALLDGKDVPASATKLMERGRLLKAGLEAALAATDVALADAENESASYQLTLALEATAVTGATLREHRVRSAALCAAADAVLRQRGAGGLSLSESGMATDASQVRDLLMLSPIALHSVALIGYADADRLVSMGATREQAAAAVAAGQLDDDSRAEAVELARRIVAGVMRESISDYAPPVAASVPEQAPTTGPGPEVPAKREPDTRRGPVAGFTWKSVTGDDRR